MDSVGGEDTFSPELYGRMPGVARVFVSSQMRRKPLAAERDAAARAIKSLRHRPWLWERDARAGPYSSERICIGVAANSDALVLILARHLTPTTRKEYEATR